MKKLLLIVIIMSSIAIKAQVTTLSLKLYLEGLYIPNSSSSSNPTGLMNPAQDYVNGNPINNWGPEYADIITVELRDNSCNVIFSSYEKLFTDGTCNVTVPVY